MAKRPPTPGSFKKGQSGNPGGRPKAIVSVQELARSETEASIKTLIELRDNCSVPAVRAGCANALLDRGWGKPAQTVNANINDKRSATDWTRDELVAYLNECRVGSERTAPAQGRDRESDQLH